MEIMTTLFLPEEFIDKTRITDYTVDLEVEMHKYLKLFKARSFFEIDMVDEPRSFFLKQKILLQQNLIKK